MITALIEHRLLQCVHGSGGTHRLTVQVGHWAYYTLSLAWQVEGAAVGRFDDVSVLCLLLSL